MTFPNPKWRVRVSVDSSIIVAMNGLLREVHVERISMTPFRWCLRLLKALEINCELLKVMVCRWAGHDVSFRVSHQLVPFSVLDVFMTTGLDIGGLEVPFDECIVGLDGEMFNSNSTTLLDLVEKFNVIVLDDNIEVDVVCRLYIFVCLVVFFFPRKSKVVANMPSKVLDNLDSLCLYDWATGVHKHLVDNLNKCMKKIMSGGIANALSLSGNVAVLQAWAVERLSLDGNPSHRRFPRMLRWSAYKTRLYEKMEELFMTADVNLEWYIRMRDRQMPEIIAAFDMFEGRTDLGTQPKRARLDELDDDTSDDGTFEANLDERLKKNTKELIVLNSRLASLTKELFEIRQRQHFKEDVCNEEVVGGCDEEAVGGVPEEVFNEEVVGGGDEERMGGVAEEVFNEEVVGGGDEQRMGEVAEEVLNEEGFLGGNDEVVGGGFQGDLTVAFDEEVGRDVGGGNHVHDLIEINDDGEAEAPKALVVAPLRAIVGDPRSTINIDQLYVAVSVRDKAYRIVCEIIGQTLSTTSINTLAPYKYIDNMLVLFATTIFMHYEKRRTGIVKRILFSSLYADLIINDYLKKDKNRRVFSLHNYSSCLHAKYFGLQDIATADFLFLPFFHDYHWWCYVVKLSTLEIYVLDSLVKGVRDRKRIDIHVGQNLARFFCMLYNRPEGSIGPLSVVQANIPSQPNLHDYGVIMLQAMQIWDGSNKFNGKSMPNYSNEELLAIRKQYVRDWILDNDNIRILDALEVYELL